jgi:hypothetical protein
MSVDQKKFFDNYFTKELSFPSSQVDAVIAFFEKRGFEQTSAASVAAVLLKQAKLDNIPVFQLLESLGNLDQLKLNKIVLEVINANSPRTRELGVKTNTVYNTNESRNIVV